MHRIGAGKYRLTWKAARIPGQTLVFQDVDARGQRRVLATGAADGAARFTARDAAIGMSHRINLAVEQNGLIRQIMTGARSRVVPQPLPKPHVTVNLRGRSAIVAWSAVRGATGFHIFLSTNDGRRLFFSVGAHQRSLRVPAATNVVARVEALGPDASVGPAGTAAAKAPR